MDAVVDFIMTYIAEDKGNSTSIDRVGEYLRGESLSHPSVRGAAKHGRTLPWKALRPRQRADTPFLLAMHLQEENEQQKLFFSALHELHADDKVLYGMLEGSSVSVSRAAAGVALRSPHFVSHLLLVSVAGHGGSRCDCTGCFGWHEHRRSRRQPSPAAGRGAGKARGCSSHHLHPFHGAHRRPSLPPPLK